MYFMPLYVGSNLYIKGEINNVNYCKINVVGYLTIMF